MANCDLLIYNANLVDGTGSDPVVGTVAIEDGRIVASGNITGFSGRQILDAKGMALSPGFIDTHTHDDLFAIRSPEMLPKLSQGVTTVIVGNCGISAAPVSLRGALPDPMNLLGEADAFTFPSFREYVAAVNVANPAINVAALVGHTALRNNHLDRLNRTATEAEIQAMRTQLIEALEDGALGLSTGLAYLSAYDASIEEVMQLAEPLFEAGGIYTTHMRTEGNAILEAMDEAFKIGRHANSPVLISHLKCAGVETWGRSGEVIETLDRERKRQDISCDCYPYAAGSSTLDLRQVDPRVRIQITWSEPHPEVAGNDLQAIADQWEMPLLDAAKKLRPAGAIYHSISEEDMKAFLAHPATMIGSDGLPCDPRPHPRLWGTFPRVLGRYCREQALFPLATAVYKMTGLPSRRFRLENRGLIREGFHADLVLFDPETIRDTATFEDPIQSSEGIEAVWVAGKLTYSRGEMTGTRAGKFLGRGLP
jgi:N-acyl-D-amino-acid deacylase